MFNFEVSAQIKEREERNLKIGDSFVKGNMILKVVDIGLKDGKKYVSFTLIYTHEKEKEKRKEKEKEMQPPTLTFYKGSVAKITNQFTGDSFFVAVKEINIEEPLHITLIISKERPA